MTKDVSRQDVFETTVNPSFNYEEISSPRSLGVGLNLNEAF